MAGDTYEQITARILALIDQGTAPWRMPWRGGEPRSFRTRKPYRGINHLLLSTVAATRQYASPYWITFAQAKAAGIMIRKGQKATPIVFWVVKEDDEDEESKGGGKPAKNGKQTVARQPDGDHADTAAADTGAIKKVERRVFPRLYSVFSLDQTNLAELIDAGEKAAGRGGVPADAFGAPVGTAAGFSGVEAADYILDNMPKPPRINVGKQNSRAYYVPADDTISVPAEAHFERPTAFYATLFHEIGHSTGHPSRLKRPGIMGFDHFGSDRYGREELVAEFTSAFLCAEAGIDPLEIENQAAYLRSWRETIKADPRLVLIAAGQAQRAADYVLGRAASEKEAEPSEEPLQAA